MKRFNYLIIGGGMAADAAVRGIREFDTEGTVGLISMEPDPPYNRPPLSKGLWKGKSLESIWRKTEDWHVEFHLGRKIVSLKTEGLTAKDDQGNEYQGEKILFATGGTPRRLTFGEDKILYYRTLEDYRRLERLSAAGQEFAIIGGGFIGSEIAAALTMNGKKVTMVFPEDGIGGRMYPHDLSQYLNGFFQSKGIEILHGEHAAGYSSHGNRSFLRTSGGREVAAAGVVAGIGIEPNIRLAKNASLEVGNGIKVNEYLATNQPNIYAAGDVAEFFNPALGKRIRFEHEDNANSMGRLAGRNMAGASLPYEHLPYLYSDLFEHGYEAVGELDASLTTAADWVEPFKKGILYYFRQERICGVLLWNIWNKIPKARELISQPGPFRAKDFKGNHKPDWRISF